MCSGSRGSRRPLCNLYMRNAVVNLCCGIFTVVCTKGNKILLVCAVCYEHLVLVSNYLYAVAFDRHFAFYFSVLL